MGDQYFPTNPVAFKDWLANFVSVLDINAAMVGLVHEDVVPLLTESDALTTAVTNYVQKQTELTSASGAKNEKYQSAVAILRPLVQRIQHHPGMTDQLRGLLRLPLRTVAMHTASVMPPEAPGIYLTTEPGLVTVHFGTEPTNEQANGKPAGVKGCNIWRNKAGEVGYQLVAFQSASPYVDTIEGAGSDYTYVVQYRGNKASDVGKSSAPSTIAARGTFVDAA